MDNDNLGGEKALLEERRKKLDQLRDKGFAYGNTFKPQNSAKKLHEEFGQFSKEELVKKDIKNIPPPKRNKTQKLAVHPY